MKLSPAEIENIRRLKQDLEADGYDVESVEVREGVPVALVARSKRNPRVRLMAAARTFLREADRVELSPSGELELDCVEYETITALRSTMDTVGRIARVSELPTTFGEYAHLEFATSAKIGAKR